MTPEVEKSTPWGPGAAPQPAARRVNFQRKILQIHGSVKRVLQAAYGVFEGAQQFIGRKKFGF